VGLSDAYGCFNELWEDDAPVVGGIRCVVCRAVIFIDKADKAGVLHAVALIQRHWEDDALGERN